jgi:tetratricopeptide (TPR) repeat protein
MAENNSLAVLNRAIQDAYVNLGMLHRQADELEEAKAALQKAIARSPE